MMSSKEFNRDYLVRVSTPFYTGLAGYSLLISLLGDKAERVFQKLEQNKTQKLIVRPFHGEIYTFIYR